MQPSAPRPRPPWTVRVVQGELLLLALLVAAVPALLAILLVSLALISLDGNSGVQTLVISVGVALGIAVVGSAAATGVIVLCRSLGRGSRRAWAVTLAAALLLAVLAALATAAVLAPALVLPRTPTAVVAALPSALAVLLLLSPATLRLVSGAQRRRIARPITEERRRPAA